MLTKIIFEILIIIIIAVLVVDFVPVLKAWFCRIHIGRYKDKNEWNKFIKDVGIRWLNNIPKIKVTDNTRLTIIDMLKGNYTRSSIQHWQEAALILGLSEYIKYNNDSLVKREIVKFLNLKFDNDGQWISKPINVDGAILAYSVMKLDFIDIDRYKNALDYIWDMIREHIGEDGTVEYRKSMKPYRYVDTVGFICPFLVSYGVRYNKAECIDLAVKQIKEYEKYGMLNENYIPCHTYKISNKMPVGLYGWGRGLGWFSIGLVDAWNEMPEGNKYKFLLEQSIKKFVKVAISFQQDNGSWNWTVTRNESRPDSSATATLGWLMLNASKIVEISRECLESGEKAMCYLMKVTRRNGSVDFSQGDTKDIGVYSMLFDILPFTQGFCIRNVNLYINKKFMR